MQHSRSAFRRSCTLSLSAALFLALSTTAFSSPRGDAWKLRRSDPQAALSQLQAVAQSEPSDAKTQYFIALVLKDLNRPQEALQALSKAKQIDPSLGFTDNPAGVAKLEQSLGGASSGSSLRGQGWETHKAGRDQEALQLLQQAVRQNPNDAKAWWFMALVQEELQQPREALQSLQNAKRIDPQLNFASSASAVAKKERGLMRLAGDTSALSGAPSRNGSSSRGAVNTAQSQEINRALAKNGVYVAPSMLSKADPAKIAQAIGGSGLKTNVVVLDGLPRGQSAGSLAQRGHDQMTLGDDGLMIVIAGRSIGAYGGGLDKTTLTEIAKASSKTFDSEGYPAGIAQIARMASEEKARGDAGTRNLGLLMVGVPVGAFLLYKRRSNKRRAQETEQARVTARDLSNKLAPQFEKLDSDYEYALLAETDPARKNALQEQRQRAGEAFSASMKRLGAAQKGDDFIASVAALQAAQAQMQRARNVLENKPENEGVQALPSISNGNGAPHMSTHARGNPSQTPPDVIEVPPLGADLPGARNGYALDFFTSQPVPRDEMVPVDLEVNGQKRRVWASRESAQNALSGQPQVATVNSGGRQQAWFDVPQYNPWQNFGSTMLQMMTMNMLLNSMMGHSHAFGGGYGGFGGYSGGWFDSGYRGGYNEGYNDGLHRGGGGYGGGDYSGSNDGYDNSTQQAANQAGEASMDSPFAGGSGWGAASNDAGSSSMDVFGGGSSFGGDSS